MGARSRLTIHLTQREADTIIAALRLWTHGDGAAHLADESGLIAAIAEDHGEPLSDREVERLADRISEGGGASE